VKKIELEIVALSSSVTQTHSYAVVLGEINGLRRLPIVIGAFEAQAIVVALERIKPSRPLTHDLFHNFLSTFHIELQEVLIHKLEEGIFFAKLLCKSGNEVIEIDSRTSDALALAVRIGCPIFTFESILETAGLFMDLPEEGLTGKKSIMSSEKPQEETPENASLHSMSVEELNHLLNQVLEQEDYVKAIAIRDEINRREKKNK